MKKLGLLLGAVAMLGGLSACEQVQKVAADAAGLPTDENVLFWTQDQRDNAFRQMEVLTETRTISAGEDSFDMAAGDPLKLDKWAGENDKEWTLTQYMQDQRAAGILVLHKGKIRLEEYTLDHSADARWTSFSVAKSFVSTLVGAAIKDGYIKSLDDPLTQYIPELKGSGYDGVSVEQLLTMTSGVQWNEDYTDAESDVAKFNQTKSKDGDNPILTYMATLKREAEPGTRWQYNTGETNLIGVLVSKATGKTLAEYLSEKVWGPFGMQMDAEWILNDGGFEIGGCCISASLRDYALIGHFAATGGVVDGKSVVPEGWFDSAGTKQADIGIPGQGYGYQWWTYDDGAYAARGIFGQSIFIDPKRELVIATSGNWPTAQDQRLSLERNNFFRAVQKSIDRESMMDNAIMEEE
ncbi:serine hydrolase domain-containing protein [Alterisphingorhabdus coralli]|uniref:Serine hydrolase domain-containing protein n=1 Tax=Alterisphingorhabdus coralli TaxID=3071408 RepID=A0AA97HZG2_9SPHN|nr:serine hydrolase domain-containing protein [Parasphingorhabdus sp. SCSIO 66989]WOE73817.1 serine hydrolase domain-containing protein [Parasphingorhabdus sp. SCSIO 66989]